MRAESQLKVLRLRDVGFGLPVVAVVTALADRRCPLGEPKDLVVSAKAQAGFAKAFGLSWADALASGNVYNATQACAKLGITADELDQKWSTLNRGGAKPTLLKFGGGFYCGHVDGLFVINGFYMSVTALLLLLLRPRAAAAAPAGLPRLPCLRYYSSYYSYFS